ncbi:unnamed protein product [Sphenostylis stenocarpa]|uniref:40S ribosomal protein S30 n=1 Tax=Sphenostylis stenocarpa TaxID=92480 RepID=A0AA86S8X1_9FABA|nr:unnamed protein product [Sphenostylis stenocarpa]
MPKCFVWLMFSIAGKVHGSLARAGKVRGQTPKVAKQDKKKKPRGRAHKRMQYNRRFVTAGNIIFVSLFYDFHIGGIREEAWTKLVGEVRGVI